MHTQDGTTYGLAIVTRTLRKSGQRCSLLCHLKIFLVKFYAIMLPKSYLSIGEKKKSSFQRGKCRGVIDVGGVEGKRGWRRERYKIVDGSKASIT